ncbi:MAG: TlpA disulfide reductase family protein [Sumerlaeia bacterium]
MRPHALLPLLLIAFLVAPAFGAERAFLTARGEALPPAAAALAHREAKATLIHVFDCDSGLCGESLPAIEEFLWQPLKDRGLAVIAVARDASDAQARAYAKEFGLTFTVMPDPDRAIASLFARGGAGVPRTIIADGEGTIVYQHAGWRVARDAEWRLVAEALIAGEEPPVFVESAPEGGAPPAEQRFVGEAAPELKVEEWINAPPGDMAGQFQMYEFWATWCGPCLMSMPGLERLSKEHAGRLVIQSISDEDPATVRAFVKQKGYTYPIGVDSQGRTKTKLGVNGIPSAFIVNPEGVIVWQGHPMELEMNPALLDELLKEKAAE